MVRESRPRLRTQARHDIEHPLGNSSLDRQFCQPQSRKRGIFRRLQHNGVPCGQRRSDAANRKSQRVVPRRNVSGDPDRFANSVVEVLGRDRNRGSEELVSQTPVELECLRRLLDVLPSIADRFAVVQCLEDGELLTAFPKSA